MEKTLRQLFDFQRFSENSKLAGIISKVEKRYDNQLSDDELENINAAGELIFPDSRKEKTDDRTS